MARQKKRATKLASAASTADAAVANEPKRYKADFLDDRKVRGVLLHDHIIRNPSCIIIVSDTDTLYMTSKDETRSYRVIRQVRNKRGADEIVYKCACKDYKKDGRNDCQHIFCERMRRGEAIVIGTIPAGRARSANAVRRPARTRTTASGKSIHTTQRDARVKMPTEIPRLITSLGRAFSRLNPKTTEKVAGGQMTENVIRALALLYKVARKKSADEMVSEYRTLILDGLLNLPREPHQNTLSKWFNDPKTTPVLWEFLRITASRFIQREDAAIIDATQMCQMQTVTFRGVDYLGDERDKAVWMKCHVITGLETNVVMAASFTKSYGDGTADVTQTRHLVQEALKAFRLKILLADKGYESGANINWLWDEFKLQAFIPLKKNAKRVNDKREIFEPVDERNWFFDHRTKEFFDIYRFRVKIEGFFSTMKRVATQHCWSRGRRRIVDSEGPLCDAWINETLCKLIYMNLRATVTLQEETGYEIDYEIDRCFPRPMRPAIAA